jgi:hypothetical protein
MPYRAIERAAARMNERRLALMAGSGLHERMAWSRKSRRKARRFGAPLVHIAAALISGPTPLGHARALT